MRSFYTGIPRRNSGLTGKPALLQKGPFFLRGRPGQHLIAMGKAPEAFDDLSVLLGPMESAGIQLLVEEQGALLVLHVFRMLKRQIAKRTQYRLDQLIQPGVYHAPRIQTRQRVRGEHMRRAAKRVARELIEQNQQGQRAMRRGQPALQLTPSRLQVGGVEGVAKRGVERSILGEPTLGAGLLPEVDDGMRCVACSSAASSSDRHERPRPQ